MLVETQDEPFATSKRHHRVVFHEQLQLFCGQSDRFILLEKRKNRRRIDSPPTRGYEVESHWHTLNADDSVVQLGCAKSQS